MALKIRFVALVETAEISATKSAIFVVVQGLQSVWVEEIAVTREAPLGARMKAEGMAGIAVYESCFNFFLLPAYVLALLVNVAVAEADA